MGISNTLKLLEKNTSFIPFRRKISHLRKKSVAIDTSIFMWKFKTSESPLGLYQFLLFLNIMLKYEIMPIFIFDGKSTILKKKEQEKRKERNRKILEYIKEKEGKVQSEEENKKIEKLKIESRIVTTEDWQLVQSILDYYTIPYIRIHGREAEGYCSFLNRTGQVDYVITEDTDVLMYGAVRWIRHINIYTGDVHIYDLGIFKRFLGISDRLLLVNLCMAFGTDFNNPILPLNNESLTYFKENSNIIIEKMKKEIENYDEIIAEFTSDDYGIYSISPQSKIIKIPDLKIFKEKIHSDYHKLIFPADDFCIKNSY